VDLKVLHLNTYENNGGAGRACGRLVKALRAEGLEADIRVNYSFEKQPQTPSFSRGVLGKAITAFKIIAERMLTKLSVRSVKIPFSIPYFGRDISWYKEVKNADILHLHWLNHAFMRPQDVAQLRKLNKPIVWTFHDSNAFTGGCHVRYACTNFEQECGNCPVLKSAGPNDLSHRIWKDKALAYAGLNLHIVAPSNWMAKSVKRSKLLGTSPVSVIPNTLDTSTFRPHDKVAARKALGLSPDTLLILSGFMPSKNDKHKGTPYLLEALELFSQEDNSKAKLLIFGNRDVQSMPDFPIKATFLGTINDDEKLALAYSAADAFISPSLEDNLPNTVMESLACGTPVVAFTTGGIPDMVDHLQNGYLATYGSAADLAAGLDWVYQHPDRKTLNQQARAKVESQFAEKVIAQQHIELYQSLLK
jgi:glycosyltransferase involved in cell wall biosynthesis